MGMIVAAALFLYLLGDAVSWLVGVACVLWYLQDKHADLYAELLRRREKRAKEKRGP